MCREHVQTDVEMFKNVNAKSFLQSKSRARSVPKILLLSYQYFEIIFFFLYRVFNDLATEIIHLKYWFEIEKNLGTLCTVFPREISVFSNRNVINIFVPRFFFSNLFI